MRKGITPVIAMILLILIVVALGGVFAAWTTRTWETLGEAGEEQIETVTENLQKSISIDNANCDDNGYATPLTGQAHVYIRNMGNDEITTTEISLFDNDGAIVDMGAGGALYTGFPIQPGQIGTMRTGTDTPFAQDDKIRVTVSGNAATYKCD